MSDKKTVIGDKMIEAQLEENAKKLNISVEELIERYIKREIHSDYYFDKRPAPTREELDEIHRRNVELDRKRGVKFIKHDHSVFVNRWSSSDD